MFFTFLFLYNFFIMKLEEQRNHKNISAFIFLFEYFPAPNLCMDEGKNPHTLFFNVSFVFRYLGIGLTPNGLMAIMRCMYDLSPCLLSLSCIIRIESKTIISSGMAWGRRIWLQPWLIVFWPRWGSSVNLCWPNLRIKPPLSLVINFCRMYIEGKRLVIVSRPLPPPHSFSPYEQ